MGAFRKLPDGGQQLVDLNLRIGMVENRQTKCRLRYENITRHHLERRTGWVNTAFVVTGGNDPHSLMFDGNLRRPENMASRVKSDCDAVDIDRLTKSDRLLSRAKLASVTNTHDVQRLRRCQHRTMTGTRMIGVTMRD